MVQLHTTIYRHTTRANTMDKSYDDLLAISNLVLILNQRINESAETISKIQAISQEILPQKDVNGKNDVTESINNHNTKSLNVKEEEEDDDENSTIRKLEEERMELVMDIQKQDFISEKLIELIDQNQEMLESVKEYLQARESIQIEEDIYTKNDIERFVHGIVQPVRDQLQNNTQIVRRQIAALTEKLIKIEEDIQREPSLLQSEEYRKEVNYLVYAFKQLVKNT